MRMRFGFACLALASALVMYPASAAPVFTQLNNFPAQPAAAAFGVVASVLGDGRLIAWDGDAIVAQDSPGADSFTTLATGYAGDPGFIAVAPDGHTCLLGAGWTGDLYLFDAAAPGAVSVAANTTHYSAVYLNDTMVLIDMAVEVAQWTYEAELGVLDLAVQPPVYRTVVTDKGGASAAVCVDRVRGLAFAADGLTGETRSFPIADLIGAYTADTPMAWAQGTLLGTFNSGGPGGYTNSHSLVFGGYTGTIQFAYPVLYTETEDVDPAGTGVNSYTVAYNPVTDQVLAVGTDFSTTPYTTTAWVAEAPAPAVPASSAWSLAGMAIALATSAVCCSRHLRKA